ncbi:DUF1302 family protein, partial [Pseudoalteromonas sp. S983]|uniref:DUF1302 family protein n=1 Tax=Pseudoalteromonas sp. S983 TaxID=579572 RepID=UPI00110AEDC6
YLTESLNSLYTDAAAALVAQGIEPTEELVAQTGASMYMAYPTKVALKGKGLNGKNEPSDAGQFGIRLGMFAPELNDTEFALYYINYHSRRPLISGKASNFQADALAQDLAYINANTIDEN